MTITPNVNFPLWAAAQDQPWLPENETKNLIDALMPGVVVSDTLTTPPASPAAGACYIVAATATDAWAGWENKIAAYISGAWVQITPQEGWVFWVISNSGRSAFTSGAWVARIEDAPQDGAAYARMDGAWSEVSLAGGMYDMEVSLAGTATASQVIYRRLLGRNAEFAADFGGSVGKIGTNPTATFDLDVQADGVSLGAVSISTVGDFTFTTVGGTLKTVLAGAVIEVIAPAVVDATASDIDMTLAASSDGITYVPPVPPASSFTDYSTLTDLAPVSGWATMRRNLAYVGAAIQITDFSNPANVTEVSFDVSGALSGPVPYGADARVTKIYDQFGSEDLTVSLASAPEVIGDDPSYNTWRLEFKGQGGFLSASTVAASPAWAIGNPVWVMGMVRNNNVGLDEFWGVAGPGFMEMGLWHEWADLHARINGGGGLDWSNTNWTADAAAVQNVHGRVIADCFASPAQGYFNSAASWNYTFGAPIVFNTTTSHLTLGGTGEMLGDNGNFEFTELVIFSPTVAVSPANVTVLDDALAEVSV